MDEACACYACRNFSRAYLRHLYMAGEILSSQLNSLHNLYFYHRLMERCRETIRRGRSDFWTQLPEVEDISLQVYYDRTERQEGLAGEKRDTVDLEFQHDYADLGDVFTMMRPS